MHCVKSVLIGVILSISPYSVQMRENTDQNNSEYGHFLRSNAYRIIKLIAIRHTFFSLQKDEVFASNTVNEIVCPETFFVCPETVFL